MVFQLETLEHPPLPNYIQNFCWDQFLCNCWWCWELFCFCFGSFATFYPKKDSYNFRVIFWESCGWFTWLCRVKKANPFVPKELSINQNSDGKKMFMQKNILMHIAQIYFAVFKTFATYICVWVFITIRIHNWHNYPVIHLNHFLVAKKK